MAQNVVVLDVNKIKDSIVHPPDVYEKKDILPEIKTKDKEKLSRNELMKINLGTLISKLDMMDLLVKLGEKNFKIYMEAIKQSHGKSNISLLKKSLKNNPEFIDHVTKNPDSLDKAYERYVEAYDKANTKEKKIARMKNKQINILTNRQKKKTLGCMISKLQPEDFEDCHKNANNDAMKYASNVLANDAIYNRVLDEELANDHDKQAELLLYDLTKKRSQLPLPQGKIRQIKENANRYPQYMKSKIEQLKNERRKNQIVVDIPQKPNQPNQEDQDSDEEDNEEQKDVLAQGKEQMQIANEKRSLEKSQMAEEMSPEDSKILDEKTKNYIRDLNAE